MNINLLNTKTKEYGSLLIEGLLNSYAQVFFSQDKLLACILMGITFFDFEAGLSGVLSVLVAQATALIFSFSKEGIRDGSSTYNVAMVGVGIGIFYDLNISVLVLLVITAMLTLFLTIWFAVNMAKSGLPFLSLPFLLVMWVLILGAENFTVLELNRKTTHTLASTIPSVFIYVNSWVEGLPLSNVLHLFFRSLGAIFFQYNDLAGVLITIGLLIYSRMAFTLALYGFSIGYFFYYQFEGDFHHLIYSYIGFNFILTAIAMGGFFVVPSKKSYLLLLFTIPVIALLISALHSFFSVFGLPLYSLPFNLVVLLLLTILASRAKAKGLNLVTLQQYSPELNHYKSHNAIEKSAVNTYYHVSLPIIGEWHIPQGHNGGITHLDEWQYAWDFDIRDDYNNSFRVPGVEVKDFYCYELPVVAPMDGYVYEIQDGIRDNQVGGVNLDQNWGNTIIIKHAEGFYSKLSHIKQSTFKVKQGDFVKKGTIIGLCGNSGRSPEPHIHFQLQTTPYIGSQTLNYPISYFLSKKDGKQTFHAFDIPEEGAWVSNVSTTPILTEAFKLIPGKRMLWRIQKENESIKETWQVLTDAYNGTYLHCKENNATAYFVNNGTMFYFTDYYGEKDTWLYHFYLATQKVLLGYYPEIELKEKLLVSHFFHPMVLAIHDFTAPIAHYCHANYEMKFGEVDNIHAPKRLQLHSEAEAICFKKSLKKNTYQIDLKDGQIDQMIVTTNKILYTGTCETL